MRLGRSPDWRSALQLFSTLRASEPGRVRGVHVATTALAIAARHGESGFVDDTYAWMVEQGLQPTPHTYTARVRACGADWSRALALWQEGRAAQLPLSSHTLAAVLASCSRGGAEGAAAAVPLFSFLESGRGDDDEVRRDAHLYTCFLQLFGRLGDVQGVQRVWAAANRLLPPEEAESDAFLHCAFLTALLRCGAAREAASAFDALPCPPSPFCHAVGIRALGAAGRGGEACQAAWERMRAEGVQPSPHCFAALLGCHARNGDADSALHTLAEALSASGAASEPPPAVCTHLAMAACARAGRLEDCLFLLSQLKNSGSADTCSYATALLGVCVAGAPARKAQSLYQELKAAGLKPNDYVFTALAAAHGGEARRAEEGGRRWEARGCVDKALAVEKLAASAGVRPSVHLYNALIAACEGAGAFDRGMGVASRMRLARVQPNNATRQLLAVVGRKGGEKVDAQQEVLTSLSVAGAALAALLIQRGFI